MSLHSSRYAVLSSITCCLPMLSRGRNTCGLLQACQSDVPLTPSWSNMLFVALIAFITRCSSFVVVCLCFSHALPWCASRLVCLWPIHKLRNRNLRALPQSDSEFLSGGVRRSTGEFPRDIDSDILSLRCILAMRTGRIRRASHALLQVVV